MYLKRGVRDVSVETGGVAREDHSDKLDPPLWSTVQRRRRTRALRVLSQLQPSLSLADGRERGPVRWARISITHERRKAPSHSAASLGGFDFLPESAGSWRPAPRRASLPQGVLPREGSRP